MDYFIIAITTVAGLYFHAWLYLRIRRWTDRDLALSMAGDDEQKRAFMLQRLDTARRQKIKRKALAAWLEREAAGYVDAQGASRSRVQRP